MQISIIIPTYNRPEDLFDCLDSILIQTTLPKEIIIVDNGNDERTEKALKERSLEFGKSNIQLVHIKNREENSLTKARNIGMRIAKGDIMLFLDDDVVLDKNYIKEILHTYTTCPNALGVQGYIDISDGILFPLKNFLGKIFYLGYVKKNTCALLSSLGTIYPYPLDRIIPCEWLSGANHSFRRQVLEEFQYDEKLKKYSEGEDIDFSCRVFRKYPGSLFITPHAILIHKVSPAGRIPKKELARMKEVYGLYLFFKNFDQQRKDIGIYLWSRIGKIVFQLGLAVCTLSLNAFVESLHTMKAYLYCGVHVREIKRGNLDFFNKTLSP